MEAQAGDVSFHVYPVYPILLILLANKKLENNLQTDTIWNIFALWSMRGSKMFLCCIITTDLKGELC